MKSKLNISRVEILATLLVFALSTCLYLNFEKFSQEIETNENNSETVKKIEIDTSNWNIYTSPEYGFSFKYPTLPEERLRCPDSIDQTPIESLYVSEEDRLVRLLDCKGYIFSVIVRDLDYKNYEYISNNWEKITFMGIPSYIRRYPEYVEIITKRGNYIYDIKNTYDIEDSYVINTMKFE